MYAKSVARRRVQGPGDRGSREPARVAKIERGRSAVPTPTRSIRYTSAYELLGNGDESKEEGWPVWGGRKWCWGGRRHVAHTPSRRRLRLRGAYQPPSIISMRISIFHPVFPKFMQTSDTSFLYPVTGSLVEPHLARLQISAL